MELKSNKLKFGNVLTWKEEARLIGIWLRVGVHLRVNPDDDVATAAQSSSDHIQMKKAI